MTLNCPSPLAIRQCFRSQLRIGFLVTSTASSRSIKPVDRGGQRLSHRSPANSPIEPCLSTEPANGWGKLILAVNSPKSRPESRITLGSLAMTLEEA